MAFSASTHFRVFNGGSDGNSGFGGGFDTGQTAGMATDGAATLATTSAPVFTSASYNFVAGDASHWIYIASGTNWIPGWYLIASVGGNAATLTAAIGTATLSTFGLNTATGCATTGSPTGATWSIDYSMATTARFTYTDLTAAGAGSTFTSVLNPFGVQQVGNIIAVSGGTNVTVQHACVISVSGVTATFDKAVTTGVTSNGAGKMGGAFVSAGYAGNFMIGGNVVWIKYNASAFISTATTSNATLGRLTLPAGTVTAPTIVRGFETTPGDETSNRPTLQWGISGASNALITTAADTRIENLICDGARSGGWTNTIGIKSATGNFHVRKVKIKSFTAGGFVNNSGTAVGTWENCEITDCVTTAAFGAATADHRLYDCTIHDNTIDGISSSTGKILLKRCILSTNKNGAAGSNLLITGAADIAVSDCQIYNAGTHGIDLQAATRAIIENTHFESNGGYGLNAAATSFMVTLINDSYYNNTSGKYPAGVFLTSNITGEVIPTGSVYTNAAGNDFSLNNTASAGAALRAAAAPTSFPGLSTNNYLDIGGVQHQDSGGGSSGMLFIPCLQGL